jgi:ABC-type branched-subunit amino acid transport system substrate-binding protein
MAIEDHFKISGRKYKLKEFISEDTTASLLTALKSASQTDCLLIVGLFTSYEALIAGSFLEKEKISGFSPVATHNDINKYFPYFRTGMASASTYIDAMTNFVLKSKKNKAILFSNNDDVYSSFFADELKNNISDFISVNHFVNDLLNPTLFELSGT